MAINHKDSFGNFQSFGVITSVKDPKKQGRVQVLVDRQDEKNVTNETLSWCEVASPTGSTQHRGVGVFPPHQFVCGTRVLLASLGDGQNKVVIGSVGNTEDKRKEHQDMNRSAQGEPLKFIGVAGLPTIYDAFKKSLDKFKGIKDALNYYQLRYPITWRTGDATESILDNARVPDHLGGGYGSKIKKTGAPLTLAAFPFNQADMKDATKAIQSLLGDKGGLIPNALTMINNLKIVAQQGINVKAVDSVGGIGNITGALSGIQSIINSSSKEQEDKREEEDLESKLRQLYRELFNKEPLNSQGQETEDYKKWKAEYLQLVKESTIEENGETS